MLIIIIVAVVILLFGIVILLSGGKNKGVKRIASILEKTIGQTPDYNKSFLAGQKNPEFKYKDDQLNFQSSGIKYQRYYTNVTDRKVEVTLYFDEQKRCQDYLLKKYVPETAYNRVYEEFWRVDIN